MGALFSALPRLKGVRVRRPDELLLSNNYNAADNFHSIINFAKILEMSSTVLAFFEDKDFSCIKLVDNDDNDDKDNDNKSHSNTTIA